MSRVQRITKPTVYCIVSIINVIDHKDESSKEQCPASRIRYRQVVAEMNIRVEDLGTRGTKDSIEKKIWVFAKEA